MTSEPKSLNVYMTARCDNACEFCTGRAAIKTRNDMTPFVLEETLTAFPSLTSACIAGLGEPLLGRQAFEVIDAALAQFQFVSLITNGRRIIDRSRIPYERLDYVSVSLNEVTAAAYHARCGSPGGFAEALAGIDHLVGRGVNVGVSFVLGKSNYERAPGFLRTAAQLKVRFVSLINTLVNTKEALTQQECREVQNLKPLAAQLNVSVNHWPIPLGAVEGTYPTCRSPYETLGVDGDGNVTGCQRILGPDPQFGNVLRQGAACYESAHFRYLRANLTAPAIGRQLGGPCDTCFGAYA